MTESLQCIKPEVRELIDRRVFSVDEKTYKAFLARLDAPPAPKERLLRTLTTTPPWKR